MKEYITPHTLANTVRMGATPKRPKAVFLAENEEDVQLARAYMSPGNCRVIPAHSRANAVEAFRLLADSGFSGVMTAVNANFFQHNSLSGDEIGFSLEGRWEDVSAQADAFAGARVRIDILRSQPDKAEAVPNAAMLTALQSIRSIVAGMSPKADSADYLREGRKGGMYGVEAD